MRNGAPSSSHPVLARSRTALGPFAPGIMALSVCVPRQGVAEAGRVWVGSVSGCAAQDHDREVGAPWRWVGAKVAGGVCGTDEKVSASLGAARGSKRPGAPLPQVDPAGWSSGGRGWRLVKGKEILRATLQANDVWLGDSRFVVTLQS